MKESKFQKQVIKQFKSQAGEIINLHGHMMQRAGLPDLEIIHRKWKGFLELKVEKGKASALQRVVAAKIELRGTPVYVLRCVDKRFVVGNPLRVDYGFEYTLENFEGGVIKTFDDLRSLLKILIEFEAAKQIEKFERWFLLEGQNIVGHYDQHEEELAKMVWKAAQTGE